MYQVLYRKWRPKTFSDVSGQPHVTAALKNELMTNRLAHAYLFTGSRGTGKTSCAKILAKAVNCPNAVNGDPCNECDICRGIDSGSLVDVAEIDAASNNGVDNIRDLREEVNFTPSVAKYRVYIIDEVHMLSTGAFNALLKTLEEPPEHVVFILATTEVHKLPATILSRCQRFDFSRISPADIAARIRYIAEQEGFTITDDAALFVARLADGAMRDALSLIDQCLSCSREITADTVAEAAGMVGREYLRRFSDAFYQKNSGAALTLVDELYRSSRDMERICVEMIDYFRNLMILRSVKQPGDLIVASDAERQSMAEDASRYELSTILYILHEIQSTLERMKNGVTRRVEMEMTVLRICSPELENSTEALLCRIQALESAVRSGAVAVSVPKPASAPAESTPTPTVEPAPAAETAASPVSEPVEPTVSQPVERPLDKWNDVLDVLAVSSPPLYGVLQGTTAIERDDFVLVCTGNDLFKSLVSRDGNKNILVGALREVTGKTYRIGVRRPQVAKPVAEDPFEAYLRQSRELGVQTICDN